MERIVIRETDKKAFLRPWLFFGFEAKSYIITNNIISWLGPKGFVRPYGVTREAWFLEILSAISIEGVISLEHQQVVFHKGFMALPDELLSPVTGILLRVII